MKFKNDIKNLVGDRAFYKKILLIVVPIMIQNGITNFVGLLDNIMVGRVGTNQMSGAAIVNQLIFVYFLCIFGGVSGAGIFTAQYKGQNDDEGIRATFRYKLWLGIILTVVTVLLFIFFGDPLINIFLTGKGDAGDAIATLNYGKKYLDIMLIGIPAFMVGIVYASTLRECGETVLPMKAGIASVVVNLFLNYILIYGKLGIPALGVSGAAIATVVSRYVETAIIVIWTKKHQNKFAFVKGLYKTIKVPGYLVKKIFIKGTPLLVNETLWALGVSMLAQCYSVRGLSVVAGLNISNTINNVFNIAFLAMGDGIAIVVGQMLGAGKFEEAKHTAAKITAFSVAMCLVIAAIMFGFASIFPNLYNTSHEVKILARDLIRLTAIFMPQSAFLHCTYFTLRSGGKTMITFLFDSVFIWVVGVNLAFILSRHTDLPVLTVYALVQLSDLLKCILGFVLVKKGIWLNNIVSKK